MKIIPSLIIGASLLISTQTMARERTSVFVGTQAKVLLKQCSRKAPAAGDTWFRPSSREIAAMERTLIVLSHDEHVRLPPFNDLKDLRDRYDVEVTGIVRGDRRYVYGSYVPRWAGVVQSGTPRVVCDGGRQFFGIEYDVAGRRIGEVDANGPG